MTQPELIGIRCITLVRAAVCSCPLSLRQQSQALDDFANERGMKVVGQLIWNGVGHGLPKRDLMALLSRKRSTNDFDALLVAEPSRLARDVGHALCVFNAFKRAQIRVICTKQATDTHTVPENFADLAFAFVRQQRHARRHLRHV